MPNYVFRCDCEIEHVASFPISEAPDTNACPDCGAHAKRVIRWNGTAVLRGQGWARHPERDSANHKKGPQ